jgi:peptidoglycan hydrolase-like protein with peptidoglycan-binding domain
VQRVHSRRVGVVAGVAAVAVGAGACSASSAVDDVTEAAAVTTVASPTAPPTESVVVTVPRTNAPRTTVPRTTVERTTVAPTTAAPTTTVAPATTPAPTPPPTTIDPALQAVKPPTFAVVPVDRGSRGDAVAALQYRLLELGFWLDGVDGRYGTTTSQAVMAFQKYFGLPEPSGDVDDPTAQALNTVAYKPIGQSEGGDLVEVNLSKQVLHLVRGGLTVWTLNTSTGNGEEFIEENQKEVGEQVTGIAITPEGNFNVNRERAEGWWKGELGELYRPKYFRGGVAVHGANNVPNYPASHGCVRVSVAAMDWIWANNLMPMGSGVWVHT